MEIHPLPHRHLRFLRSAPSASDPKQYQMIVTHICSFYFIASNITPDYWQRIDYFMLLSIVNDYEKITGKNLIMSACNLSYRLKRSGPMVWLIWKDRDRSLCCTICTFSRMLGWFNSQQATWSHFWYEIYIKIK